MKSAIKSLLCCTLLAGCETPISERAIKLTTPDVVEYDKVTQVKAANEMDKVCGIAPTICNMLVDYGVMRDQARIAKGEKVNVTR